MNDQNVHFSNDQPLTHHMQFMIEMQFLIAFFLPQDNHKLDTKNFRSYKNGKKRKYETYQYFTQLDCHT